MLSATDQSDQDQDPLDEDRRAAGHGEMNRRLHPPGQHLTGDMNADLRFAAGKVADEAS
jgi:hypothetical protein